MINYDAALELIDSVAKSLGTEVEPLATAAGRVLAEPVVASIDSPRCDVSAMDGYAVRDADLSSFPARLPVAGESYAGAGHNGSLDAGTCIRIFTGAPVPAGADRIVIQEDVGVSEGTALIDHRPGEATHIRKQGSDFRAGDTLLPAGWLLDPRAIVAAAGADVPEVTVHKQPRLLVLSTGDELVQPGSARAHEHSVPESVSFGIAALAAQCGARCVGRTMLPDDPRLMHREAATAVTAADLIVVTGGASVGEKDFAKAMFEPLGLELIFSKVAIKPGKPVWLGRAGGRLVLGLPGNPTSALVTARLLLLPLIAGMSGRSPASALNWRQLPLATPLQSCGGRETFHRARLQDGAAAILSFQDSSAQKTLAEADLLVRQSAGSAALPAGADVTVLDF